MRVARPSGLGSWSFVIEDEHGAPEATVEVDWRRDAGTLRLGDVPFAFAREGWLSRTVTLSFQGVEVARAERRGAFGLRQDVRIEAGLLGAEAPLHLVVDSTLTRRRNRIVLDGETIGAIDRRGLLTRTLEIDGADALPLGVQAFLLALVVVEWRRAARSSG